MPFAPQRRIASLPLNSYFPSFLLQGGYRPAVPASITKGEAHLCDLPGELQASQLCLILLLCDIVCQSCAEIQLLLLQCASCL